MQQTILIVDDEPAIRGALRRALRHEPYRILDAGGAAEALAIIEHEAVDLLLSDHNMPGGTGLELCEAVQLRRPALVRVLMTGAGDARLATQALAEDTVYHVIQKPWDMKELQLLLRLGLRHGADLHELERLQQLVRTQRRIITELEQGRPAPPPAA